MMDERRTDGQPPASLADFFAALDMLAALGRERRLRREREQQALAAQTQAEAQGAGDGG